VRAGAGALLYNPIMEEEKPALKSVLKTVSDIEDLPEPMRSMIKQRLAALKPGESVPPGGQTGADPQFSLPPGLVSFLNLVLKVSEKGGFLPVPAPEKPKGFLPGPAEAPSSPQPFSGPLKPSSAGWLVWLAGGVAIACLIYYHLLGR